MINNYYKYGPSTFEGVKYRIVTPYKLSNIPFGKFYVNGNYIDGSPAVTADNSKGVFFHQGTDYDRKNYLMKEAFASDPVVIQDAEAAYESVLKYAGASLKRDTLDARIIKNVWDRTGSIIDVQGGYPAHSPFEITLNAWPELKSLPAPVDTDKDGIPDDWEKKNGLSSSDASDASKISSHKFYTNIEVYINSITK
jgi:hypothetical protein